MLFRTVLCCTVAALCCVVQHSTVQYYQYISLKWLIILCNNIPRLPYRTVPFRFVSFRLVSFRFVLFCFVLFCFVLFCFVLFCFVLFCFVLFCFVLFCTVSLSGRAEHSSLKYKKRFRSG